MSIFAAMREDLEKNGWHQGSLYAIPVSFHTPELAFLGAACLQGAYQRCTEMPYVPLGSGIMAGIALAAAISELYPDWHHDHEQTTAFKAMNAACTNWCIVVNFNDDPHTTYEDVIRVLKHAEAADAIQGGQG